MRSNRQARRRAWGCLFGGSLLLLVACDRTSSSQSQALTARPPAAPAGARITPSAAEPPRAYALPHRVQRHGIVYAAETDRSLPSLAQLIEDVDRRLSRWATGRPPETGLPARFVYLCRDLETLLAIERHHDFENAYGHPDSASTPDRTFPPRGGYYHQLGVIALLDRPGSDVPWNIAHEASHAALSRWASGVPDVLDEGLAEVVTAWALYSDAEMPADDLPLDLNMVETCLLNVTQPRRANQVARLFDLDYWQFRDERRDDLHFSLATSLLHFLLSDAHPGVVGRFPLLIERLRREASPWFAFQKTYPVGVVERRWQERLESWEALPWRVGFGRRWVMHGGHLSARRPARGSTALVWRGKQDRSGLGATFQLPGGVPERTTVGFVTGFRSPQQFVVLGARLGGDELIRVELGDGDWGEPTIWPCPEEVDARDEWRLELEPGSSSWSWRIGGQEVWREPREEQDGTFGLYFESRQPEGSPGTATVTFRDVSIEEG